MSRFLPRLPDLGTKNLLPNGSFELGTDQWASLGRVTGWGGDLSGLVGEVTADGAADGTHALRIALGPGLTPVTHYDVWPAARVMQHAPLVANVGWIPVKQGVEYTLSAYLRADTPGVKARLVFRHGGAPPNGIREESEIVTVTREWARHTLTRPALEGDLCIAVGPDMTDQPSRNATFWLDAIQLEKGPPTPYESRGPVEVGIETGRYGNVFHVGEPVVLRVHARNTSPDVATIEMRTELRDYFDEDLPAERVRMVVGSGQRVTTPWTLPLAATGFYRARVSWNLDGAAHSRELRLAVIEPYEPPDSPFGTNHVPTTQEQCRQLRRAGVTWARDWSLNWEWSESEPGKLTHADSHIDRLGDVGLNVVSLLPANPSTNWASEAPPEIPASTWKRLAYAPKEPKQLYAYVGRTVRRFRDRVHVWEFLNEPLWVPDFCLPQSAGYTVQRYLSLLKGARDAMKAADPDCTVVGGLSIQAEMALGDEFIRAGGLDLVDVYNLHPYPGHRAPECFIADMRRILAVMDERGGRKPIWATECAYYGADDKPWEPWFAPANHHGAEHLLSGERTCADYTVRFATILLAHGVEKLFWHEPIEGPVNSGSWDLANPLLAERGTPRKLYAAHAALANMLGPKPAAVGEVVFPEQLFGEARSRCHGYAFQCGERAVCVVWATEDAPALLEIALPPGAEAFDIVGRRLPRPAALGPSPMYIRSNILPARELSRAALRPGAAEPPGRR